MELETSDAESLSATESKPLKVSFCTTVKNRGQHLAETLPQNLANNPGPNVEFVILDYGDEHGIGFDEETKQGGTPIKQWLLDNYRTEIESGRIRYARTEQEHFKMAHAKNMAHRLATGDVLCNLDADNVTGEGFAEWLKEKFVENPHIVVRQTQEGDRLRKAKGTICESTGGRLAIGRENFLRLHGYDEHKHNGYTGDDNDLVRRARNFGLKHVDPGDYLGIALQHDDAERLAHLSEADKHKTADYFASRQQPRNILDRGVGFVTRHIQALYEEYSNPDGNFGCGETTVLRPDTGEEKHVLLAQLHPEVSAAYSRAQPPLPSGWGIA